MRCGRMRCGDIWRCGSKKKGGETGLGNKMSAPIVRYRPQEIEAHILMRNNGKDYISIEFGEPGESELQINIALHGGYVNEPQMEAIKNLFTNLGEVAALLLIGLFEGQPGAPTEGTEGIYGDEFMEKINVVYENPTEENINMFMAYIMELMQEIQDGDFSRIPIHFTKYPQYEINEINLSPHEINGKGLQYVSINYSIGPRQVAFSDWPEATISPERSAEWEGRQGTDSGGIGTFRILSEEAPITITFAIGDEQDACRIVFDDVDIPVQSIEEHWAYNVDVDAGKSKTIKFNYSPQNATDFSGISRNYSDGNIAEITNVRHENGTLYCDVAGLNEGICTITGTLNDVPFTSINASVMLS